jgi:hypothetical protein
MIEDHLAVPFETRVLGMRVTVQRIALGDEDQIVVVCARGRERQMLPILALPLPTPAPAGVAWIEAYRRWRSDR